MPLVTAMPCLRPKQAAKACSQRCTKGPLKEIQPVSMHSVS